MSAGFFEHRDKWLCDDIYGYNHTNKDPFEDREISDLIYDVFKLIHSFDYYKSGDSDESDYLSDKKQFKEKWFNTPRQLQIQNIINTSCEELKQQLEKTFM